MWSMPRSVLQVVALLIGLCAVGGFALGMKSGLGRVSPPSADAGPTAAAVTAADAKPLNTDAPLPPPEPEEKTEAEKAKELAEAQAEARMAADKAAAERAAPPSIVVPPPPPPAPTPPAEPAEPEEPPH